MQGMGYMMEKKNSVMNVKNVKSAPNRYLMTCEMNANYGSYVMNALILNFSLDC